MNYSAIVAILCHEVSVSGRINMSLFGNVAKSEALGHKKNGQRGIKLSLYFIVKVNACYLSARLLTPLTGKGLNSIARIERRKFPVTPRQCHLYKKYITEQTH